jgi:pimeloyl-ACP methyl ester carboxylesterase
VDLAVAAWPGDDSPPILAVHATGFCKETWEPFVAELRAAGVHAPIVAFDQRSHGRSGRAPVPLDWWELGHDVAAVADALESAPPIAVGHSSGATALVLAELIAPGRFEELVLVEPIIFPPPFVRYEENPMTAMALKRKAVFADAAAAFANFSGKGPFARWEERSLHAYVAGGITEAEGGALLRCSPKAEAEYYRGATLHGAWDRLGELRPGITLVSGADSDTHTEYFTAALAARFRSPVVLTVPDATHFVPMEEPAFLAGIVAGVVAGSDR